MADYVPNTDEGLIPWLTNLKTKLTIYSATLGLSPARAAQIIAWCDASIAALNDTAQKKAAWLTAAADKNTQAKTSLTGLRAEIGLWKKQPTMADAIAADLQIVGAADAFDADNFVPDISGQAFAGHVRIKFKKNGADGINIYTRKKGEPGWKFLAPDTDSPYDDHTPLAVAGQPEVREYQAFGVLGDDQIGQPSDIVSVTFAG